MADLSVADLSVGVQSEESPSIDIPIEGSCILPGLPNAVALQCLARVPRSLYANLKTVSRAWRDALSCREIYRVRRELGCTEAWIYLSFASRTGFPAKNWFEAYDPAANEWKFLSWMPGLEDTETLKGFACVSVHGSLYVIGGRVTVTFPLAGETQPRIRNDVYMYDCICNTWTKCCSMSAARVDFACSACNGMIYVAGGRSQLGHEKGVASAEMYDPKLDCWYDLPKMTTGRYKCVGVTLNNKVYVIGGFTSSGNSDGNETVDLFSWNRSSVEVYEPGSKQWVFVKGMWQLDIPPYQVVNLDGHLYSSGDLLKSWKGGIELYDELLNMWKAVGGPRRRLREDLEYQNPLRYVTMAAIGKQLYFLGGYCNCDHEPFCLVTVSIFNTTGGAEVGMWQALPPVDKPCRELCSHCCVADA